MHIPRILIAAPASGSGKTAVTCALLAALKARGLRVRACKCGPDYIDPMFHLEAAGVDSRNLDLFFSGKDGIRDELSRHGADADLVVAEGVMGYYDGRSVGTEEGSSYDVARTLEMPVLLVVNGRGAALSLAALVSGMAAFRPDSNIRGLLLNRVSEMLYPRLKEMLEKELGRSGLDIPVLGYIPEDEAFRLESRHLGLVTPQELEGLKSQIRKGAQILSASVELERILEIAGQAPDLQDAGVVFPHFVHYMSKYTHRSYSSGPLIPNLRGDGYYVWEKEHLIDLTLPQVLDRMVEEFPERLAFDFSTLDYTRTYSEFRDDVDRFARALVSLGVKRGDHVAIWATNVPQWYITFWATVKIGAVLVTVNTAYKIYEAEYLLRQSDTHTLVMTAGYKDSDYVDIMRNLCPELASLQKGQPLYSKKLPFLRNIITCGCELEGCLTWEEAQQYATATSEEEITRRSASITKHDVCNMQYTSGTTGFPKGVMLTHYNVVNNGKAIGDCMDLSTADTMMIQVPMFHCFGMVLAMTAAMTHGVTMSPLPYFRPADALRCINLKKVTCFHGVPTMFIALLEHPDFASTDFSHMRTGIMAGSPCPVKVMQQVIDEMHMSEIVITYGQTEASPGCTMSKTTDTIEQRVNTVGQAMFGVECRIVDPETYAELPDGVDGEFVARGYNIMKGYYKMPAATALAIDKDGWLHTGDLARRTPDGYYKITGRIKDMIIRGGENIYPKELEDFIYTHPKVSDVQVIGVPDKQYGEEIMACVIVKEGETLTEDELREYIRSHIAKHKCPKYIEFTDSFPMNAAGKILKYKMREAAVEKLGLVAESKIVTA